MDDKYFYLSDFEANQVHVWEGLPDAKTPPVFSISVNGPWRLSSDGEYLAVTSIYNHAVYIYRISDMSASAESLATIGGPGKFNLPQDAIIAGGSLFIADTGFNRVHIWKDVADAISGKDADVILGKGGFDVPPLQLKDAFFWPGTLAFE